MVARGDSGDRWSTGTAVADGYRPSDRLCRAGAGSRPGEARHASRWAARSGAAALDPPVARATPLPVMVLNMVSEVGRAKGGRRADRTRGWSLSSSLRSHSECSARARARNAVGCSDPKCSVIGTAIAGLRTASRSSNRGVDRTSACGIGVPAFVSSTDSACRHRPCCRGWRGTLRAHIPGRHAGHGHHPAGWWPFQGPGVSPTPR